MFIANVDALKAWLTVILEPLCDADSSALARYVLALVKKDKPVEDLRNTMNEQLDVFLGAATKDFVARLFHSLSTEEYLNQPSMPAADGHAVETVSNVGETFAEANDVICIADDSQVEQIEVANGKPTSASLNNMPAAATQHKFDQKAKETNTFRNHKAAESVPPAADPAIAIPIVSNRLQPSREATPNWDSDNSPGPNQRENKENTPRETRKRLSSWNSRSRSRSRSPERHARRSRSRDRRVADRDRVHRHQANPDQRPQMGGRRNFDRRRPGALVGGDGFGARFGGIGKVHSNRSRSRSPSPDVYNQQHASQTLASQENQRLRCRDFDEKGYCVRGGTCPWDHGTNPVVFDNPTQNLLGVSMREYNPDAPDLWSRPAPSTMPPALLPPQPAVPGINPFSGAARNGAILTGINNGMPNNGPVDYMRTSAPPMVGFPFNPTAVTTPMQRQLVPIPVIDATSSNGTIPTLNEGSGHKRRYEMEDNVAVAEVPPKRKPNANRAGTRVGGSNVPNNCSLELRKVPRGLNTITHLNDHFSKFGKITNIQVSYEGDPEAAIITFSAHAEANVAYRSTEAVLNNRFIKVFWHNTDNSNSSGVENSNIMAGGGTGRKNMSQYHLNNVPVVPTPAASDSAKTSNATPTANNAQAATNDGSSAAGSTSENAAPAHPPPSSLRLNNNATPRANPNNPNAAMIRKKQEEHSKAVVQLAHGLQKRKQELLDNTFKQLKSAIQCLERTDINDTKREKTKATVAYLEQVIKKLQDEIAADQGQLQVQLNLQQQQQAQIPSAIKKTKEQLKKELLDLELEIMTQQQEGQDTTALQKRFEELKRSVGTSNGSTPLGGQPAGKGAPPFGRHGRPPRPKFSEVSTRVDRRPKTIVVTGFEAEDADFVLGHFKHFGEITKHDVDRAIPQLIISYSTRTNAEQAVLRGKTYKNKILQLSWAPVISQPEPVNNINPVVKTETQDVQKAISDDKQEGKDGSESFGNVDLLPEIPLEDEEDDEIENEDRAWRH